MPRRVRTTLRSRTRSWLPAPLPGGPVTVCDRGDRDAGWGADCGTSGHARAVSPFCPTLDMTGPGVSGWRRPKLPDPGPAATLATFPHLGQAPAPSSKEKRQPQKHATSVITGTFFLCGPLPRSGQPVTAAEPEPSCTEWARDVVLQQRGCSCLCGAPSWPSIPACHVTQRVSFRKTATVPSWRSQRPGRARAWPARQPHSGRVKLGQNF